MDPIYVNMEDNARTGCPMRGWRRRRWRREGGWGRAAPRPGTRGRPVREMFVGRGLIELVGEEEYDKYGMIIRVPQRRERLEHAGRHARPTQQTQTYRHCERLAAGGAPGVHHLDAVVEAGGGQDGACIGLYARVNHWVGKEMRIEGARRRRQADVYT